MFKKFVLKSSKIRKRSINGCYFWTNLGPMPLMVELIFRHITRSQNSKTRLLLFWTKIVIIGPTITLSPENFSFQVIKFPKSSPII